MEKTVIRWLVAFNHFTLKRSIIFLTFYRGENYLTVGRERTRFMARFSSSLHTYFAKVAPRDTRDAVQSNGRLHTFQLDIQDASAQAWWQQLAR